MRNYKNYADMITFSRASSGTALAKISGGGNLLSGDSSTFTTGFGDWAYYTGGTATVTNGAFTYSAGGATTYQIGSFLTVGKAYKITYDFTRTVDTFGLMVGDRLGAGTQVRTPLGNGQLSGTITGYIICGFNAAVIGVYANSGGSGTIDNVIIEEVLYDQPDGTLQLFNHPANQPRVEYDYQGNRLGLLVEEARTNLLTYSEDFSNSEWSKLPSNGLSSETVTGPFEGTLAYRFTSVDHNHLLEDRNVTVTAGTTYTFSFWGKDAGGAGVPKYLIRDVSNSADIVKADWPDVSATEFRQQVITFTAPAGCTKVTVSVASYSGLQVDFYVWGAQLEAGSFPTSYIPTSGAAATRSADVASIGVTNFGYNKGAGSFVVAGQMNAINYASRFVVLSDTTANNRILTAAGDSFHGYISDNGSQELSLSGGTSVVNEQQKVSFAWKKDNAGVSLNGGTVVTDTSATIPTGISRLSIGSNSALSTTGSASLHISSITYYPRRLTNAQIQKLTSVSSNSTLSLTFDGTSDSYLETNIHG